MYDGKFAIPFRAKLKPAGLEPAPRPEAVHQHDGGAVPARDDVQGGVAGLDGLRLEGGREGLDGRRRGMAERQGKGKRGRCQCDAWEHGDLLPGGGGHVAVADCPWGDGKYGLG